MQKQVKRFDVLDSTDKDVAVAFWYEDGTKEIIVMTMDAVENLVNSLTEKGGDA